MLQEAVLRGIFISLMFAFMVQDNKSNLRDDLEHYINRSPWYKHALTLGVAFYTFSLCKNCLFSQYVPLEYWPKLGCSAVTALIASRCAALYPVEATVSALMLGVGHYFKWFKPHYTMYLH